MALAFRALTGERLLAVLDDLARLRITVFRDFPYLYDGSLDYERGYLATYASSTTAIVVGAFNGPTLVGAATGTMMAEHAQEFAAPLDQAGLPPEACFYCAESVLLAEYRGQGAGHAFFDQREAHARALGATWSVFCSVVRPSDHPLRPADYRPLDGFWRKRGYAPCPGSLAKFRWQDVDQPTETEKPLQLWARAL